MSKRRTIRVIFAEEGEPSRILLERDLDEGGRMIVALKEGEELPDFLGNRQFDVLVQDLEVPHRDGGDKIRLLRGSGLDAEVVVVSASGEETDGDSFPLAGEKVNYLTRPLSPSEIKDLIRFGVESKKDGGQVTKRPALRRGVARAILGESQALVRLLEKVDRVAAAAASVLILGETGTGKSLVARALHEASPRREKPFVVVNCSAFQDQLLESELFGHEKGAFTGAATAKRGLFEIAHGGTLFLDEVAEMSPAMQAKLLTTLDTGDLRRVGGTEPRRVDARIVAATNKNLEEEVREGRFRDDLRFRLAVVSLEVPPLRERREDLPILIEHFLDRSHAPGGAAKTLSAAALKLLQEHTWPGNIRELANTVEGLTLLAPGTEIRAEDLPPSIRPITNFELEGTEAPLPMAEVERLHVARALSYTEGKKAPAARLLGIDVKTLTSKIRTYGIKV